MQRYGTALYNGWDLETNGAHDPPADEEGQIAELSLRPDVAPPATRAMRAERLRGKRYAVRYGASGDPVEPA